MFPSSIDQIECKSIKCDSLSYVTKCAPVIVIVCKACERREFMFAKCSLCAYCAFCFASCCDELNEQLGNHANCCVLLARLRNTRFVINAPASQDRSAQCSGRDFSALSTCNEHFSKSANSNRAAIVSSLHPTRPFTRQHYKLPALSAAPGHRR